MGSVVTCSSTHLTDFAAHDSSSNNHDSDNTVMIVVVVAACVAAVGFIAVGVAYGMRSRRPGFDSQTKEVVVANIDQCEDVEAKAEANPDAISFHVNPITEDKVVQI